MGHLEKIAYAVSFSIMITLLFLMVYSENGVLDWLTLRSEATNIEIENQKLAEENRERVRKIERLKQDMGYIEHIARHELGMAKKDELIFKFREKQRPEPFKKRNNHEQ